MTRAFVYEDLMHYQLNNWSVKQERFFFFFERNDMRESERNYMRAFIIFKF